MKALQKISDTFKDPNFRLKVLYHLKSGLEAAIASNSMRNKYMCHGVAEYFHINCSVPSNYYFLEGYLEHDTFSLRDKLLLHEALPELTRPRRKVTLASVWYGTGNVRTNNKLRLNNVLKAINKLENDK